MNEQSTEETLASAISYAVSAAGLAIQDASNTDGSLSQQVRAELHMIVEDVLPGHYGYPITPVSLADADGIRRAHKEINRLFPGDAHWAMVLADRALRAALDLLRLADLDPNGEFRASLKREARDYEITERKKIDEMRKVVAAYDAREAEAA